MKKPQKKSPVAAWIGQFQLSEKDRAVMLTKIDEPAVNRIQGLVATHRDLYRPHLKTQPTAQEIVAELMLIQKQGESLIKTLQGLNLYSNSQLLTVAARCQDGCRIFDIDSLQLDLIKLATIAKIAAAGTPTNAGAGTRTRGQSPTPDAILVQKIAKVLNEFSIEPNDHPTGEFVLICQAISNSGGFEANDVRGSIRVFLKNNPTPAPIERRLP